MSDQQTLFDRPPPPPKRPAARPWGELSKLHHAIIGVFDRHRDTRMNATQAHQAVTFVKTRTGGINQRSTVQRRMAELVAFGWLREVGKVAGEMVYERTEVRA